MHSICFKMFEWVILSRPQTAQQSIWTLSLEPCCFIIMCTLLLSCWDKQGLPSLKRGCWLVLTKSGIAPVSHFLQKRFQILPHRRIFLLWKVNVKLGSDITLELTVVVVEERDLSTFVDRTWRMHDLCSESQTAVVKIKSLVIYLWFRHDARLPCCIVKSGLVWSVHVKWSTV